MCKKSVFSCSCCNILMDDYKTICSNKCNPIPHENYLSVDTCISCKKHQGRCSKYNSLPNRFFKEDLEEYCENKRFFYTLLKYLCYR
jgi:hypothetical protein